MPTETRRFAAGRRTRDIAPKRRPAKTRRMNKPLPRKHPFRPERGALAEIIQSATLAALLSVVIAVVSAIWYLGPAQAGDGLSTASIV
jgi:hypothetical protein